MFFLDCCYLHAQSTDGVAEVVECLDDYCLTRDDWDSIVDISHFPGKPDVVARIPTKVCSYFLCLLIQNFTLVITY